MDETSESDPRRREFDFVSPDKLPRAAHKAASDLVRAISAYMGGADGGLSIALVTGARLATVRVEFMVLPIQVDDAPYAEDKRP